jgi:hypothetical protein
VIARTGMLPLFAAVNARPAGCVPWLLKQALSLRASVGVAERKGALD